MHQQGLSLKGSARKQYALLRLSQKRRVVGMVGLVLYNRGSRSSALSGYSMA